MAHLLGHLLLVEGGAVSTFAPLGGVVAQEPEGLTREEHDGDEVADGHETHEEVGQVPHEGQGSQEFLKASGIELVNQHADHVHDQNADASGNAGLHLRGLFVELQDEAEQQNAQKPEQQVRKGLANGDGLRKVDYDFIRHGIEHG